MKRRMLLLFCLAGFCQLVLAQNNVQALKKELRLLKTEIKKLKSGNAGLHKKIDSVNHTLKASTDSLQMQTAVNTANIRTTADELGIRIEESHTAANQQLNSLNTSIGKKTVHWLIAFSGLLFLSATVYFLLHKRISKKALQTENQIALTRKALEEESIRLDTRLAEILETQIKLTNTQEPEATDHALALKVADEIVRIQKNFNGMDPTTKGLKQLAASVQRIKDYFAANGYEMPDLLNRPYDPKMKVIVVNSVPDESIRTGEEIITRIIKPQVNYKGVMIQPAQVEVSVGV